MSINRAGRSRFSPRSVCGLLAWIVLALAVFALGAPFIHGDRFQRQIRAALEGALGRKIEIGAVTLTLLSGPGFEVQNVIIGEDPAFGIEHFAYTDSMRVRLSLRTLWTRRVQVASLTLINPSINLVKNAQGRWNFEALLERARARAPADHPPGPRNDITSGQSYFPYIGIQGGRVNFKFGDYKSIFHFQNVEAALSPARDAQGRWSVRFEGTPARADRLLSGMGIVKAEGEWSTGPGLVRIELSLAPSPLEHLLTLFNGRDIGVHGEVSARTLLRGPVSDVKVQGSLETGDFHRWDLLPSRESRFSVPFAGVIDLPGQSLQLATDRTLPVRVDLTVTSFLAAPVLHGGIDLDRAPARPFWLTARHLGMAAPDGMNLAGRLTGRLDFAGSRWPSGSIRLEDGGLVSTNSSAVAIKTAEIRLDGPAFQIPPADVSLGRDRLTASASGRMSPFQMEARLSAERLRVENFRPIIQTIKPGWLLSLTSGSWRGQLNYRKAAGEPGLWNGSGVLSQATWQPRGLESPIQVAQARVRWDGGSLRLDGLDGLLGEAHFTGNCIRRPNNAVPGPEAPDDYCQIRFPGLDLGQLDAWLNPQQKYSRWEIWRRIIGGASPSAPSWLRAARIQGEVSVGDLHLRDWTFHNVRSDLVWTGQALALNRLRAELGRGPVTGSLRAEFTAAGPRYRLQASAKGLELRSLSVSTLPPNFQRGSLDISLALSAAGRTAPELAESLAATGAFSGHSIVLDNIQWKDAAPESDSVEIGSLDGRFELTRGGFDLTGLSMTIGKETYLGRGSIGGRPPVLFDVAAHGKPSRLLVPGVPATAVTADTP